MRSLEERARAIGVGKSDAGYQLGGGRGVELLAERGDGGLTRVADAAARGAVEARARPGVERPGEVGVARLVGGDADHHLAHGRIGGGARLPRGEQRAEGLAHAAFGDVLDRAISSSERDGGVVTRTAGGVPPWARAMARVSRAGDLVARGAAPAATRRFGALCSTSSRAIERKACTDAASRCAIDAKYCPTAQPSLCPAVSSPAGQRPDGPQMYLHATSHAPPSLALGLQQMV